MKVRKQKKTRNALQRIAWALGHKIVKNKKKDKNKKACRKWKK